MSFQEQSIFVLKNQDTAPTKRDIYNQKSLICLDDSMERIH